MADCFFQVLPGILRRGTISRRTSDRWCMGNHLLLEEPAGSMLTAKRMSSPTHFLYREHLTVRTHAHIFLTAHFTRDHTCGSSIVNCCESSQEHSIVGHAVVEHSFDTVSPFFSSFVTTPTVLPAMSTASDHNPGYFAGVIWPTPLRTRL